MIEKHDIVKVTKQLIADKPAGVYFLHGGEEYLKRRFLLDLKNAVIPKETADLNFSALSGADAADKVLELSYMLPQFSDARMVVWYNSGYPLCPQRYKKATEDVIAASKHFPYLYLIIYATEDEFDVNSKDGKTALSKFDGINLYFENLSEARLVKWTLRHLEADGVKAEESVAEMICRRCACKMTEIANACEKLAVFAKEKGREAVLKADVDALVPEEPVFSAFYISDCIRKRNAASLLNYVDNAKKRAEKPQLILASIISEAEKLARIKAAQTSGVPFHQTAKMLGLNEYVVKLAYPSASALSEKQVADFLHKCYEADKKLKSSQSDAWGTVKQLICSI